MANWDRITQRGNVEDRRSMRPVAIGAAGIAILLVVNLLLGGNPLDLLPLLGQLPSEEPVNVAEFEGEDSYEIFASTVLGSNNDAWTRHFSDMNKAYVPPKLVLFRQATQSECGTSTSQVGPHYCPLDQTIYLDETFFDELKAKFGAQGGDVAEAYVISHEVGHHVQNQLGQLEEALETGQTVDTELQADCYAGLWAYSIKDQQVLMPDEIKEAMDTAAAVGDDRIQEKMTGSVNPETWTHGSSQQRVSAFMQGYESGELSACDK